jgi:hypothetical protein
MYVLGGVNYRSRTAKVVKYDSVQGTWSEVAPMPVAKHMLAVCAIGSDIFVFGGYGSRYKAQFGDQDSVFKYDTVADAWSTLAPMPQGSYFHSASVLDGLAYVVGAGHSGREVLRFDPASGAWSTLASTLSKRQFGSCFELGGCLYAAGGMDQAESSVERYDVAATMWTAVAADMIEGRRIFGAVTIGSTGPAEDQNLFDVLIAKASRVT